MLQIVFSDSECGALKQAVRWRPSAWDDSQTALLLRDGEQEPTPEERERAMARVRARQEEENRRAGAVGGNPGDVLCPCMGMEVGPLSGPGAEKARFELHTAWLGGDFPLPGQDADDPVPRDTHWQALQRDRKRLLEGGRRGEAVRVWYSSAPCSLCGFHEVLWLLRDCDCPVSAVEMPRWMAGGDGTAVSCLNWGELSPGDWAEYLSLEREIPRSVRRAVAAEWARLREENAPLRAVVNGRLHSVGEDFYDPFIRSRIPDGTFRVGQVIGEVIGQCRLGISDWWIARRIRAMRDRGELVTVSRGDWFYRDEMRRGQ